MSIFTFSPSNQAQSLVPSDAKLEQQKCALLAGSRFPSRTAETPMSAGVSGAALLAGQSSNAAGEPVFPSKMDGISGGAGLAAGASHTPPSASKGSMPMPPGNILAAAQAALAAAPTPATETSTITASVPEEGAPEASTFANPSLKPETRSCLCCGSTAKLKRCAACEYAAHPTVCRCFFVWHKRNQAFLQ